MKLTTEPNVDTKIRKMKERVRWQHPKLIRRAIDQTRLCIEDDQADDQAGDAFAFLVVGDSGTGRHRRGSPQRQVAERLLAEGADARFVIHTGDVVYLVGSREQYRENFIKPYREFLVNGDRYRKIRYHQMIFNRPFLPVLGNHDYYDIPWLLGLLTGISWPLRYVLRHYIDLDVGWHGSFQGNAYAKAFLDYLQSVPEFRLDQYLDLHYTSEVDGVRCLTYSPGEFTRLPNRYYTFRYSGIDFFALDSNTFNQPLPIPDTPEGEQNRRQLEEQRRQLEAEKADLLRQSGRNMMENMMESDGDDAQEDLTAEIEQIDEQIYDIDKQLSAAEKPMVDLEQLQWLRDRLIDSWRNPAVRGRIVFFHHPPYVTEATKWPQGQTLAVRYHLRQVLNAVAAEVGDQAQGRPLVDLMLSGHAHCLDYVRTGDTGHSDAHIPWIVCGGSGYSLRRQRPEGPDLPESMQDARTVATSHLFLGRTGKGSTLRRPYSGLRIEVSAGTPPKIRAIPLVAEKKRGGWHAYRTDPIDL